MLVVHRIRPDATILGPKNARTTENFAKNWRFGMLASQGLTAGRTAAKSPIEKRSGNFNKVDGHSQ